MNNFYSLHSQKFWIFFCYLLFFSKLTFSGKKYQDFSGVSSVSNSLDPDQDQDRCIVGPELDLNCMKR